MYNSTSLGTSANDSDQSLATLFHQHHNLIRIINNNLKELLWGLRCELVDFTKTKPSTHSTDKMAYISLDIQFVFWCIMLICFGILVGLYLQNKLIRSSSFTTPVSKFERIKAFFPKHLQQVYWDTQCGICRESYENTYIKNRSLSVNVLAPCYHTCCPECFSTWKEQAMQDNKQLKCFFCNCNVLFPFVYRIQNKPN